LLLFLAHPPEAGRLGTFPLQRTQKKGRIK
jgi:hypothetical protein